MSLYIKIQMATSIAVFVYIFSDSEWWYARDGETGTSGYVPSNYLRPLGEVERRDDPDKSNETGKDTASGDKEVESASASSSSSTAHESSTERRSETSFDVRFN